MRSKRMKRSKKGKRSRIQRYKTRGRNRKLSSKVTKIKRTRRKNKVKKSKRLKGGSAGGSVDGSAAATRERAKKRLTEPGGRELAAATRERAKGRLAQKRAAASPDEDSNPLGFLFKSETGVDFGVDPGILKNISQQLDHESLGHLMGASKLVSHDEGAEHVLEAMKFITDKRGRYDKEKKSIILRDRGINDQNLRDLVDHLAQAEETEVLQDLNLSNNQIQDVTPLASLTALTGLSLGRNQIKDVTPLASLTALTGLYLEDNQIVDVQPLQGLINTIGWDRINLARNPIPFGHVSMVQGNMRETVLARADVHAAVR